MNVLLISANREDMNMPALPMGLACVAAAVEGAGHAVRLLDLLSAKDMRAAVEEAIRLSPPAVIGVSVRNIDDQCMDQGRFLLDQAKEVVRCCRESSAAPIVLGGAGYSIFPQSALEYLSADMGIQGEGEAAFPMLLERIGQKGDFAGVPGLHLPGRGIQGPLSFIRDLDSLPYPEPETFASDDPSRKSAWLPYQTRRGCPLGCSYCSTASIEGRLTRRRSPAAVVANLAGWARVGFSQVFFVDNTFNRPAAYAIELCRRIAAAGLKINWRCIFNPGEVSRELVEAMATAGCREVSLGFESGGETMLRSMNKHFGVTEIREASRLLAEFGIRRMGFLLLGGPGETRASVEESLSFAEIPYRRRQHRPLRRPSAVHYRPLLAPTADEVKRAAFETDGLPGTRSHPCRLLGKTKYPAGAFLAAAGGPFPEPDVNPPAQSSVRSKSSGNRRTA